MKPIALSLLLAFASAGIAQAQATRIILVRHGEKAAAPAADPDLTDAGKARALALATAMKGEHLTMVLSTPYARTMATAAPTAAVAGLTIIKVPVAGGVAAYVDSVVARLATATGTVLVVGHSNTIGPLLKGLGAPAMEDLCDYEYDAMFVVEPRAGVAPVVTRNTVGNSDPPGAHDCHKR